MQSQVVVFLSLLLCAAGASVEVLSWQVVAGTTDGSCPAALVQPDDPPTFCAKPGDAITAVVTLQNSSPFALHNLTADYSSSCYRPPCAEPGVWLPSVLHLQVSSSSESWGAGQLRNLTLQATAPSALGLFRLAWRVVCYGGESNTSHSDIIGINVEVTCSDGLFCNGAERFVNGSCVAGSNPCVSSTCAVGSCSETQKLCLFTAPPGCSSCMLQCEPKCNGKACGMDGCGGFCSPGCNIEASEVCFSGQCVVGSAAGTCGNPIPIFPSGQSIREGYFEVSGNTGDGYFDYPPTCLPDAGAPQLIYYLDVPTNVSYGVDVRTWGFDTILEIRKGQCVIGNDYDSGMGIVLDCDEDSSPPGNLGSRIATKLEGAISRIDVSLALPNRKTAGGNRFYFLISGFSSSSFGNFTMSLNLVLGGCVPQCDDHFCGPDSCGSDRGCGDCAPGQSCGATGKCTTFTCSGSCAGKACGDDGCGSSCGECPSGMLCALKDFQCRVYPTCNHLVPVCPEACGANEYCGTDCTCKKRDESDSGDLYVPAAPIKSSLLNRWRYFDSSSCSWAEECISSLGWRRLLRFSVETWNIGKGVIFGGSPLDRPNLFEYSRCHAHFHMLHFAKYYLVERESRHVVVVGRKQAFCMVNSRRIWGSPEVECRPTHTCNYQGIASGWTDVYSNALDCQWIDITDVVPGNYTLIVSVNYERVLHEASFDNNVAEVPIEILETSLTSPVAPPQPPPFSEEPVFTEEPVPQEPVSTSFAIAITSSFLLVWWTLVFNLSFL